MSRETQPYKRSFSASVGSGLGSLLGGSGKQYYILEHKISSKFHEVGESQEIIVDNIELGRDPKCQVRFDESFTTVSRQHAAIIKEGDKWKLVQLSSTNPTFLNGRKVAKEWYLQSGDEIELSIGGPKLGFIVPTGNKSTVGSIGLSRRLSLFRQQALRPYKTALTTLSCLLLLVILGAGGGMYWMNDNFEKGIKEKENQIAGILANNDSIRSQFDSLKVENERVSRQRASVAVQQAPVEIQTLIDKCKDDVYFLYAEEVYLTDGSRTKEVKMDNGQPYSWMATGFLLDDGRFVTARHCVQAWRFETDESILESSAIADSYENVKMIASIKAINRKGKTLSFKSTDFKYNDAYDGKKQLGVDDEGTPIMLISVLFASNEKVLSTDWAYVKTSSHGTLKADKNISNDLRAGTELHVLGFPMAIGVNDTPSTINPTYNKFSVGRDRLDNSGCFLHTRGTDHGNSGGPIFTKQGDRLVVIGIVSRGSHQSEEYNHGVPISAID